MTNTKTVEAGERTQVEMDYIEGKWVPSYYGHGFTVANKLRADGERDTTFIVGTLAEAQREAHGRNAKAEKGAQ